MTAAHMRYVQTISNDAINTVLLLILAGFCSLGWNSKARGQEFVDITTESIFTPEGFDDNDNAQVVLDGWLPSRCDRALSPAVKIDKNTKEIIVTTKAIREGVICSEVATRYSQVVDLGVLPWGDYKVTSNTPGVEAELSIHEADNAGPDDYEYAVISKAYEDFAPDFPGATMSRWTVILEGQFLNSCQALEDIVVTDSGDTIEVQPILVTKAADFCLPVVVPFVDRAPLPDFSEARRLLLHVRSHNGNAVNKVFSVQ